MYIFKEETIDDRTTYDKYKFNFDNFSSKGNKKKKLSEQFKENVVNKVFSGLNYNIISTNVFFLCHFNHDEKRYNIFCFDNVHVYI